jgi:hypothetical protein
LSLGGLSDRDADDFLQQRAPGLDEQQRGQVVCAAGGRPDYLDRVARCVKAGRSWTDVVGDLEEDHRRTIRAAQGAFGRAATQRVLGLLCVSREPLPLSRLVDFSRMPPETLRQLLTTVGPHLITTPQGVAISQDSFRAALERKLPLEVQHLCHEEMLRWSGLTAMG